ncbi:MAG: isoprenylcysteine carboxylmethyltransferase family protein [Smithella sp.]
MIEKFRIEISRIFVAAIIIVIALSDSMWETRAPFVCAILFMIGCILVGIASLGRLWCSLYIAGYKTDSLVTEGPYSLCRNPLYFFSLIGAVGVGFASETLTLPVVLFLIFTIYYPFVIKSEEAELSNLHDAKFKTYFQNVPRFFPKLSNFKEPEEYIVKPAVFRKHIFDALWFIWLIGIMEILESLHELHVLPTIFKFY